ncbi:hypothetical protein ACQ33O_11615 [Ferruginibacter sp. SUN002]|uniref:hypothetical protein n=1 Tax=Ferruginibacter sp. SUN002 TaxID=2937789 RepID=UPI003D360650
MAETLGMLCDKLTIVKLKQYHTDDETRLQSLNKQSVQLQEEIDQYFADAISGVIPADKITFAANKVFKKEGNETAEVSGKIGEIFYQLADVNCQLWHEVEKGYNIENVPIEQKDQLVKSLAVLNLQRNKCIDAIDLELQKIISK